MPWSLRYCRREWRRTCAPHRSYFSEDSFTESFAMDSCSSRACLDSTHFRHDTEQISVNMYESSRTMHQLRNNENTAKIVWGRALITGAASASARRQHVISRRRRASCALDRDEAGLGR